VSFEITKHETVNITKDLAYKFANKLKVVDGERTLKDNRISTLKRKYEAGEFLPFNWAVAVLEGVEYRVNGQHSSHILAGWKGDLPTILHGTITTYKVNSKEELAELYASYDPTFSNRDIRDNVKTWKNIDQDFINLPDGVLKLAVDGVFWCKQRVNRKSGLKVSDKYKLFTDSSIKEFVLWYPKVVHSKTAELKLTYISAAMFSTFEANPKEADKFWREVGSVTPFQEMEAEKTPSVVLDKWLSDILEKKELKATLKPDEIYQGCIYAWNAFRQKKKISVIAYDVAKRGITVPDV